MVRLYYLNGQDLNENKRKELVEEGQSGIAIKYSPMNLADFSNCNDLAFLLEPPGPPSESTRNDAMMDEMRGFCMEEMNESLLPALERKGYKLACGIYFDLDNKNDAVRKMEFLSPMHTDLSKYKDEFNRYWLEGKKINDITAVSPDRLS